MADVVWIARHGNRQDFVDEGWKLTAERPHDPGLSEDGIVQAQRLGARLAGEGITQIIASPFLRTVQTAHYVAERTGGSVFLEWGLCEWLNPKWFPEPPVTLPFETLAELYPEVDLSYRSISTPRYPETADDAWDRIVPVARALAEQFPGPVLLVGHGVTVTAAAQGLVEGLAHFDCALCSVAKIVRRDGVFVAELCGDVSHLEESIGAYRYA